MRQRGLGIFASMCAFTALLLLPGAAQPTTLRAAADPLSVSVDAPSTAYTGDTFSYTITLDYSGSSNASYTVTDPLPSQVVYHGGWGSTGAVDCPTRPDANQNGTFSCTVLFTGPATATIRIDVDAVSEGTATNTVSVSNGASAIAATTISAPPPPPRGSLSVTTTGPGTDRMDTRAVPPPITYTTTFGYVGPALGTSSVQARFTAHLPEQMKGPSPQFDQSGEGVGECSTVTGPPDPNWGNFPFWTDFSCTLTFSATLSSHTMTMDVHPTGKPGMGTYSVTLPDGTTSSVTTEFIRVTPPAPPPPPPPLPPPTATTTGTVTVNGSSFTSGTVPFGSTVDVTEGTITLKAKVGTATLYGDGTDPARFVVERGTAKASAKIVRLVELRLVGGNFGQCGARSLASDTKKKNKKVVRALWGKGKGKFRTHGRHAAATVRGTRWLTADRCDGTLTKVERGVVSVRDFTLRKTVTVRAGQSYLAQAHR